MHAIIYGERISLRTRTTSSLESRPLFPLSRPTVPGIVNEQRQKETRKNLCVTSKRSFNSFFYYFFIFFFFFLSSFPFFSSKESTRMNLGGFKLVYATRNYANDLPFTMQHCRPSGNKSHVIVTRIA